MKDINSIKKYIFYDVFDYFVDAGFRNEKDRYLQAKGIISHKFIYSFSKFFLYFLNLIYKIKLKNNKTNEQGIYFYADPLIYSDIVFELSKKYNLFFNNPLRVDKRIRFKNNIYYFPLVKQAKDLVDGFLNKKNHQVLKSFDQLTDILGKINPKIIVLNESTLPINRAIIQVSKELGIQTIEIQHAIYPYEMKILPGIGTDFVYVWGDFFKKMYNHQNIRNSNTIKILGYPFKTNFQNKLNFNKKLTLYYLAQGFHNQDIKNLDRLLNNALNLRKLSNSLNIKFKCKLHPNSPKVLLNKVYPHIKCNPLTQTMEDAISDGDIFISFNSTALIEAAFQGKKCIQLMNLPVESDNFEDLGICKTFLNFKDLNLYLTSFFRLNKNNVLDQKNSINDKYIKAFDGGPGLRFTNLIEKI